MENKKAFSLANLSFLLFWLFFWYRYAIFFVTEKKINFALLGAFLFSIFYLYKYPLLVKCRAEDGCNTCQENTYYKDTNFIENLLLGFFKGGRSELVSLFSGYRMVATINRSNCCFSVFALKPKVFFSIIEAILLSIFPITGVWLANCITTFDLPYGICLYAITTFVFRSPVFLRYIRSVKIGKTPSGYDLRIVFPNENFVSVISRKYGLAIISLKTVIIDSETLNLDPNLFSYIVAHEEGHIKSFKTRNWFKAMFSELFALIAIVGIFPLSHAYEKPYYLFITAAFIIFVILQTPSKKKIEFLADTEAAKIIGKDQCLKALDLIIQNNNLRGREKSSILNCFFAGPTIQERIQNLQLIEG